MMTAWMMYSAVVGVLVAAAALLLHALRKDSGAPVRWIWAGAMVLTVALTVTAPWRGQTANVTLDLTRVTQIRTVAVEGHAITLMDRAQRVGAEGVEMLMAPLHAGVTLAARAPRIVNYGALLLWATSCTVALVLLATMYRRAVRMRHTWSRRALCGVTVRVSPDAGPAVIGIAPPEIVVPQWLLERTPEEQQLVLEHESSHVNARDPWLLLSACVAVALMPWNPAMWFMLARLRLAVELDCDRRVLRAGAGMRSYGQLLIELSQHRSILTPAMPAFSHSASHLERRLLAITARPSRPSLPARVGVVLLAGVALLAACESALPTSAELQGMNAAAATKRAAKVGQIDTANVYYVIDDHAVSKQEAEAVASERIASINIVGGKNSKTGSTVSIRTLKTDTAEVKKLKLAAESAALSAALNGKIVIVGRDTMRYTTRVDGTGFSAMKLETSSKPRTNFNGLLIVDGVETESSKMSAISPDKIQSVEVVKGVAATTKYTNPLAANGVIVITLKK